MKTTLKISFLLNLGLLVGVILLWSRGQNFVSASIPPVVPATPPPASVVSTPAPPVAARPEPPPFRWRQLYAKDYHEYVKNLRAIGCPEPAIRALVTADVNDAYRQRSIELEQKLDDLSHSSWSVQLSSYNEQQALITKMQELPAEKAAIINDLLGLQTAAARPLSATASTSQPSSGDALSAARQKQAYAAANNQASRSAGKIASTAGSEPGSTSAAEGASDQAASFSRLLGKLPPPPKSAALPLVFQPVDAATLNLSESQLQAVNDLRQEFINTVSDPSGDSTPNPNDPAYQEKWQEAQFHSDEMLLIYVGYNKYIRNWIAQYQKSLAIQLSPPQ
jgi:hypothetical protein